MTPFPRIILRVELTPPAKYRLDVLADDLGMTRVAILSRLMEWFATQPEVVQAAVLGHYPEEIRPDVARMILERMGGLSRA